MSNCSTGTGNKALIAVDDNKYEVDIVEVEKGVYSILYNGKSTMSN